MINKSMMCPECLGENIKTTDSVSMPTNEVYRRKKCKDCGAVFFTLEFVVEYDERVKAEWNQYHRSTIRKNNLKKKGD